MGSTVANIGSGLISGFQFGEGVRRNRVQDERLAAQDERAAAQEGRRAEMDGLTIQNAKNTAAEYDANAPVRQGALSEKLAAQKEAEEARLNEQSLFLADKQYQVEGDLSGYKNAFKAADPNYELHSIGADPKTGEITIEVADIMGGTITPKKFKDYGEFTGTLAKFASPSAYKSAIAQAQAQREKLEAEDREEQRDVRGEKRKQINEVELERMRAGSREELKRLELDLRERIAGVANGSGGLSVTGDINKRVIDLMKYRADNDHGFKRLPFDEQWNTSWARLFPGEAAPAAPVVAPSDNSAAGGGINAAAVTPKPLLRGKNAPAGKNGQPLW